MEGNRLLEDLCNILNEHHKKTGYPQLFFSACTEPDKFENIHMAITHDENHIKRKILLRVCHDYEYYEILGLTDEEEDYVLSHLDNNWEGSVVEE